MGSEGEFHKLPGCSNARNTCTVPMADLSKEPFNLHQGGLITMQGNGPYNGRYYYNWLTRKNTITKPPKMKAFLKRGELILHWDKQKTAKDYEIWWNTSKKECGEFEKLATTRKNRHTI